MSNDKIDNSPILPPPPTLIDSPMSPTIPKEKEIVERMVILLENSCSVGDVTKLIIFQINSLQDDIKELEEMKTMLKNIFPTDMKSYRSAYVIENKVKTFTGFHTTILSYKKELNGMLLKLRSILDVGTDLEQYKKAMREVMMEHSSMKNNLESNKEKINDIIKKTPSLMPSSL